MKELFKEEQQIYDNLILLINKYVSSKKRKEEVIEVLDNLVDELTGPHIDIDEINRYFFGGEKKWKEKSNSWTICLHCMTI